MAPKRLGPTDPREWLNRANSNLERARRTIKGVYLEDLCFDAQQCAEKAIKAVFVHRGLAFPYVHDLAHLLGLLEGNGVKVPKYEGSDLVDRLRRRIALSGIIGSGGCARTQAGSKDRQGCLAVGRIARYGTAAASDSQEA